MKMRNGFVAGCLTMLIFAFIFCGLLIPACCRAFDELDRRQVMKKTVTTTIVGGVTNTTVKTEYIYK